MALRSEDFDPIPESARAVRRFLQESLPEVAPIDDIVLDGSELASNAIRHARTEFSVRLVSDAELVRLEVSDGSSINPAMESLAERGRGLRLIETLSHRLGIESTNTGKTVWAEFGAPGKGGFNCPEPWHLEARIPAIPEDRGIVSL